jgi:hypothetical protein
VDSVKTMSAKSDWCRLKRNLREKGHEWDHYLLAFSYLDRHDRPLVSSYEMVLKVVSVEINCAIDDDVFLELKRKH